MTEHELNRRDFVKAGAAGAAAVLLQASGGLAQPRLRVGTRPLGQTGHHVGLFSLGGQATLEKADRQDEAVAIVNRAIDLGVNYIDTAAAYGRGQSQRYIGEVMATRRREVFLASKTHDRSYDGSMRLLEESLQLLQTDHLDLWQIHRLGQADEWDRIRGPGGALRALERARAEDLVRFLGVTGHYDPVVLTQAITDFEFDTILMALNAADPHYLPFTEELLPTAHRKGMGIIAMKIPARGRLFREGGLTSMRDAMHWVLSQPVSTVIVGCDTVAQLEDNVAIAAEFRSLGPAAQARISSLTSGYAREAQFYKKGARHRTG